MTLIQEILLLSAKIKHTQLTRVGYTYQDFMCIQLLVEWFHQPDKYQWVCVEGTKAGGRFKGLDDIIAFNKDGRYELIQVKFTIDSERDDLKISFDWLLEKAEKGTSFLQKWEADTEKYNAENLLSIAALKTNRVPDDEVEKCLCDNKINIDLIPESHLEKIKEQLGGYQKAKDFFDLFTFDHSQPEIDDFENKLKDGLVPDHCPTEEGWLRFLKAVERWATRENEPAPDGKIKIEHIRDLVTTGKTRSISQFFEIPEGYTPPSEEFHTNIVEKTKSSGGWVISGLPGMGKSTYLSYLTEYLIEQGIPVIRHHYSLTAQQSVIDRITYPNAARSLQSQLQQQFPVLFNAREYDPELLDEWIKTASDATDQQNTKLVVIIDGLDHVARERSDITQLEHLINKLIPLRGKICLILGTQPVSDVQLPSLLTSNVPRDQSWLDLPPMDLNAIKCWIEGLSKNENITLIGGDDHKARELVEISEAFHKISGGYPLHLIYSIKSLSAHNKHLTKYDIERLPTCPDGDIHNYYATLWSNLSASAREILLLIACVEFPWPDEKSIGSCFQDSLLFKEACSEIQHLIEKRRSGIVPFHGSIIVFLRKRQEYQSSLNELLTKAEKWLEESAPEYWRWGWEWIIKANLGNTEALVKGVTRDWSVESFYKGYPLQHIEHIISIAEQTALEQDMLPELVSLRLIKTRLINAPEYQLQEYSNFLKCALIWHPESYGLLWRADNLRLLEDKELSVVAYLFKDRDDSAAEDCLEEAVRRLRFYARIRDSSQSDKINSLIEIVIDILINMSNPNINRILNFLDRLRDKETFFGKALDKLFATDNGHLILDISSSLVPEGLERLYWDYFILACCHAEIKLADRTEKNEISLSPLGITALTLENLSVDTKLIVEPPIPERYENATGDYFYNVFFTSLAKQMKRDFEVETPSNISVDSVEAYIGKAATTFKFCAYQIAQKVKEGSNINLFEIYELISKVNLPDRRGKDFESTRVWHSIAQALTHISVNLYLLLKNYRNIKKINAASFDDLKNNSWWDAQIWLRQTASKSIFIVPQDILKSEIQASLSALSIKSDNTMTLANDSLDLAELSCTLSLKEEAEQCLKLAAQHALGYGWRKDITLHELYEAIDACSEYGVGNVPDWLRRVAPFTNNVFEFTEREIRHIPGWYIELLAKHMPERLVDEFDHNLTNQNWFLVPDILESFVKYLPLNTGTEHAFLKCQTTYETLSELKKRAEKDSSLLSLYKTQCKLLGGFPPAPKESTSDSVDEKNIDIAPESYPPEQLKDLDEELSRRNLYLADEFMESWIAYWSEKDRSLDIIAAFEKIWNEEKNCSTRIARCLHTVFLLSKKLQGTKKAYPWAVRDIRANNHWGRWSGSRSEECLHEYARIYKSKWKTFLIDTTKGELIKFRGNEWIVVPTSQLVKYLLAATQPDLACQIAEVMLESLENEIAHLPIPSLHWYEKPVPSEQIASHFLLLYYKWPDRLARIRTANEMASLLDNEPSFKKLYLDYLGKQSYEVEITDLLSVLFLTENQIFSGEKLRSAIRHPSILSDEILLRLGYENNNQIETRDYHSELTIKDYVDSERFEKAKDGMAPIYFGIIEDLGNRLNYPLSQHLSAEWDIISTRQDHFYFNPYDFCGDRFYRQDRLSCSFSTQTESIVLSAFLRTLSFAHSNLNAPYDKISTLSLQVIALAGLCSSLLPAMQPSNWPSMPTLSKDDELPTGVDLDKYLDSLLKSEEIILRANGPVSRDLSGLCCDLDISVVCVETNSDLDPKSIYETAIAIKNNDFVHELASPHYPSYFGRWEVDWLLRGYFRPEFGIGNSGETSLSVNADSVDFLVGNVINATWKYWTLNWYPAYYRGLGCSFGTYLTTSKTIWEFLKRNTPGNLYIIGKLTIIDKRNYISESVPIELYAIKEIGRY